MLRQQFLSSSQGTWSVTSPQITLQTVVFTEKVIIAAGGRSLGILIETSPYCIRRWLDAILPSPIHAAQGKLARETARSRGFQQSHLASKREHLYSVGTPRCPLYCGLKHNKKTDWVLTVV
ncbi:hypothetical protein T10_3920, partial [Trichinella papuae]